MDLVDKYNKLKKKQEKARYRGKEVTLYKPELRKSKDKNKKKLQVFVRDGKDGENGKDGDKIKRVEFGHEDYEDFTTHRDKSRKKNYCARSKGIKCDEEKCGPTSANFWSRMVLWNC